MFRAPFLAALLGRADAFPVAALSVTETQLEALQGGSEALATDLLLPELMAFFQASENSIAVERGDVVVQQAVPDTNIDDSCSHTIDALHSQALGDVLKTSYLSGGVDISWDAVKVFMDGEVDASLDINCDVRVRTGVKTFGHCSQVARDTMNLDVTSTGRNGIGVSLTASNAHVESTGDGAFLVFDFHADIWGTVLEWRPEEVSVNNGCKMEVLGVTVVSVCGYIERRVQEQAQTMLNTVTKVTAPKLLAKLEEKINTAVGSEVRIPLNLASSVAV